MDVAMLGLGRMGANMARRLLRGGHRVVVWNRTYAKAEELVAEGAEAVRELTDVPEKLTAPRVVWLMLPHGETTQEAIDTLAPLLDEGDVLIDGGNSYFKEDIARGEALAARGLRYLDVGTSGGVWGLEVGYCMMIGGERSAFEHVEPLLATLAPEGHGYDHMGGYGSGHFVKMVHNGIEYGLMQAYGEGFELLKASPWDLDMGAIADLWNHGSVVRSWLLELAADAFEKDPQLDQLRGYVEDTGEGRWTVQQSIDLGVPLPVIALSLYTRFRSRQDDSFSAKVLAALRNEFGGHAVTKKGGETPEALAALPNDRLRLMAVTTHGGDGASGYEEAVLYDGVGERLGGVPKATPTPSPFGGPRSPDPCTLTIFGVTGDLAHRKLIPALYDMACHQVTPEEFTIVGYGRQEMDDDAFRELMQHAIDDHYGQEVIDGQYCERILRAPHYVQGQFDDPEGYRRLAGALDDLDERFGTRGNRMYYLATPPRQFPVIVEQLGEAGLARRGAFDAEHALGEPVPGWTRIVIEKPFGHDLESAQELNRIVQEVFDERQVYRIDHYLAKETVQNLLALRFANGIFEPVWNRRYIDHVQITAAETLGVEHRGPYYEEAGALRDMVKDHLVQLFSLVAMEPPVTFDPDAVRDEKNKALRAVREIPRDHVELFAARGQYVEGYVKGEDVSGYRREERVAPDSATETFAAVKLLVDNWRWQGVPFYLRTGKRMAMKLTEILIQFRRPPIQLFREASGAAPGPNQLILQMAPDEGFALRIESKVPGQGLALQKVQMGYSYGSTVRELPFSAYETVLVDAMEGDPTLFNRADQVEQSWRVVQPILDAWREMGDRGLHIYEAGTWGPEAADALVARDGHTWRRPPQSLGEVDGYGQG